MSKVAIDKKAPDFQLTDYCGYPYRLSDFRGKQNLVLIFNRGFT
jgi:peroxiredoxin